MFMHTIHARQMLAIIVWPLVSGTHDAKDPDRSGVLGAFPCEHSNVHRHYELCMYRDVVLHGNVRNPPSTFAHIAGSPHLRSYTD